MLPSNFIKPRYDTACFADLPQTIRCLLTGQGQPALSSEIISRLAQQYDTVIFFFIDAFGWRFVEKYQAAYPCLQTLINDGVLAQLTAQFPSTTANHVTCIHTGLPVGQSGVYEWQYYEPHLDAMIAPLLFSFAGTTSRDTLKPTGIDPKKIYPTETVYRDLQQQGVASYVFQNRAYAHSTYSNIVFDGAEIIPYKTISEALVNLTQRLLGSKESPAYYFLYFDQIDAICHQYGPQSLQLEAEIDTFLTTLDRLFLDRLSGRLKNSLLMMAADHGQVDIDPQTTIYLNTGPQFAGLAQYLRTDHSGDLLVPAGSPRDLFLYVKDGRLDEAQAFLAERLEGKAIVYQTQHLIEQGLFGHAPPSSNFTARAGNLVILPLAGESVWWYEKGRFEQRSYGHHGGLTPAEMEIPLFLYTF